MGAADDLHEYTDRSNALHQEYRVDPELLAKYQRLIAVQLDYLLPFYEDLRKSPDYSAAVDFVISDLTGVGISQRDHDIARVVPIMCKMLPEKALQTVASAMQLNARVLDINLSICRELYKESPIDADISEADYCSACRRASTLDECLELIRLTGEVGQRLDHVVRIPMIGLTLRAMRRPARVAGFGALQEFLEKGYTTFVALEDVDEFLDDITRRMTEVFTRIYTEPLENLRH
ncbi:MAG: hypothetical protein ACE5KS_01610 [Woeseiaceae bacterium]